MKIHSVSRSASGFALIVSLSLMILLALVAVGLLSLATVQVRGSGVADASQQAKANARLGLVMALAELQRTMGPDQRISAPGAQKLAASDTSARQFWLGTWDSWTPDNGASNDELRPETTPFHRWLISGKETVVGPMGEGAVGNAGSEEGLAKRLATLTQGGSAADPVRAGIIEVEKGGYAWWVADQNTKAKLGNPVDAVADVEEAVDQFQASPQASPFPILGADVPRNDPRLNRLVTLGTSELFTDVANTGIPMIHTATPYATGLLTNVHDGGLRKDLSFILETPWDDRRKEPLYTAGSTPGINFSELWLYHNLWGEIEYGPPTHADGTSFGSGVPFIRHGGPDQPSGKTGAEVVREDPFYTYTFMTKLRGTFAFSLFTKKKKDNATNKDYYDLFLVFDPIVTLWNPYNVAYHIPHKHYNGLKFWGIPYSIVFRFQKPDGTTKEVTKTMQSLIDNQQDYLHLQVGTSQSNQNMVMRSGEVQVISQGFDEKIEGPPGNRRVYGQLGWNLGSGLEYDVPTGLSNAERDGDTKITFRLVRNDFTSNVWSLTHFNHAVGTGSGPANDETVYVGQFAVDGYAQRTRLSRGQVKAPAYPEVFHQIPADLSRSKTMKEIEIPKDDPSLIAERKWPIFVYSTGVRTSFDNEGYLGTRFTGHPFLRTNPKSRELDLARPNPQSRRLVPLQLGIRPANGRIIDNNIKGLGFYGADYTAAAGSSHVITHALPLSPVVSLGTFQNAIANGQLEFGARSLGGDPEIDGDQARRYLLPSISHPIANSFAPSVMKKDEIRSRQTENDWDIADHSYLANLALWDDYFVSSISPKTTPVHHSPAQGRQEQKESLKNFLEGNDDPAVALPNSRYLPRVAEPEVTLDELFPGVEAAPDAADKIAAHILVDGAFNVNSTSVDAWRSVLSGLRETQVPVRDALAMPTEAKLTEPGDEMTPVNSLLIPGGGPISESDLSRVNDKAQWTGFRVLTDEQITELAEAIVKQVRLRGPFLSLADFVNRRPGTDTDLALSGALQSALDDEEVSINQPLRQGTRSLSVAAATSQGYEFPEAEAGAKAVGAPAYVKQGDLLTALAPFISVRGDTFLIRSYGEATDADGNVLARAWCEATVQRMPEYLDLSESPEVSPPLKDANKVFGRRFQIVSFRYLSPEEIVTPEA